MTKRLAPSDSKVNPKVTRKVTFLPSKWLKSGFFGLKSHFCWGHFGGHFGGNPESHFLATFGSLLIFRGLGGSRGHALSQSQSFVWLFLPSSGFAPEGKSQELRFHAQRSIQNSQEQILAAWILTAKLLNSDLIFSVDFAVDFFLLSLPRKKAPNNPPKNPSAN